MKTVHKYPFRAVDQQTLLMPAGAKILHAGLDPNGSPCLWALVDPDRLPEPRLLAVTGTGHMVPDNAIHRGSVTHGMFVWHVWEVLN